MESILNRVTWRRVTGLSSLTLSGDFWEWEWQPKGPCEASVGAFKVVPGSWSQELGALSLLALFWMVWVLAH